LCVVFGLLGDVRNTVCCCLFFMMVHLCDYGTDSFRVDHVCLACFVLLFCGVVSAMLLCGFVSVGELALLLWLLACLFDLSLVLVGWVDKWCSSFHV